MKLIVVTVLCLIGFQIINGSNGDGVNEDGLNNGNDEDGKNGEMEPNKENYGKLTSGTPLDFNTFASKCSDIGEGWAPAILNSQSEVDFLKRAQKDFGDNTMSYWIDGSTNAPPNSTFDFNLYFTGNSGSNRVVISTWTQTTGPSLDNFQLMAKPKDDAEYSMLCEKNDA